MATNTFSSLAAHLHNHSRSLTLPFSLPQPFHQYPKLAAALALAISISIPTVPIALKNYRGYLALGPGGPPYNLLGWSIQGVLQLVAKWDTRDPGPFANPRNRKAYEPYGSRTFFSLSDGESSSSSSSSVPERQGPLPDVPGYVAPQRQMTQQGGAEMRARMLAYLESLAARNPGLLTIKPSGLEGIGTPALWLDDITTTTTTSSSSSSDGTSEQGVKLPAYIRATGGEITHVHPEASSHIIVSMADAGEVVRKGWAERHRLSGVWGVLPWSFLIVYAPRDEGEFEVWKAVVRAGVRFVCAAVGREEVVV